MYKTFYLVNFVLFVVFVLFISYFSISYYFLYFLSDGAMRHTAKSNLLYKIKIKKYSLLPLMGNPNLSVTVTDFVAILQSIDYRKFERFSNVAEEISTKLLSSFLEC